MTTTRVRAHERRNPHGGMEHVKEHSRRVDGPTYSQTNETNFENEEQDEKEKEDESENGNMPNDKDGGKTL